MKKILFGFSMLSLTLMSAQNYPDYYPNNGGNNYPQSQNGWGNGNQNNGYYGDEEDQYYFPDDYYYQYPSDYYTQNYYQNNYNEYLRSINDINWNRFFVTYRLAPWQIREIIALNQMYPSYSAWDQYYRYNPDRWYYDRFYALQNILGPNIFVIFQNTYYGGYNPVIYYQNYRVNHYARNVYVVPRYRNININVYRVDRTQYHVNNPRQNWGSVNGTVGHNNPRVSNTPKIGGVRTNNSGINQTGPKSGGFRNNETTMNQSGVKIGEVRNNDASINQSSGIKSGGFRNPSSTEQIRTESDGFRTGGVRTDNGIRQQSEIRNNSGTERRMESGSTMRTNNGAGLRSSQNSGSNSGMRLSSR